jgi:hypothetical protein
VALERDNEVFSVDQSIRDFSGFESSFQTVFRIFLEYIVCFEIEKIQEISGIFKMLIFAGM